MSNEWTSNDQAVHVIRESDVDAVEVTRDGQGWYADRVWYNPGATQSGLREHANELLRRAAQCEAIARAVEAGSKEKA